MKFTARYFAYQAAGDLIDNHVTPTEIMDAVLNNPITVHDTPEEAKASILERARDIYLYMNDDADEDAELVMVFPDNDEGHALVMVGGELLGKSVIKALDI